MAGKDHIYKQNLLSRENGKDLEIEVEKLDNQYKTRRADVFIKILIQ